MLPFDAERRLVILYFNNHWPSNGMDGPNDLSKAVPQDSTQGNECSSEGNEISGRMMMLDRD